MNICIAWEKSWDGKNMYELGSTCKDEELLSTSSEMCIARALSLSAWVVL